MSTQLSPILVHILIVTGVVAGSACIPGPVPRAQGDAPRRRRGTNLGEPFLTFHGRSDQMGDLAQVASAFRLIAVDADPANQKFSANDLATLQQGGRNIVLGILNLGFCDRDQSHWLRASEGLLPCVANLGAQIEERTGRPRQVWIDLENAEYHRLIGEYVAPRLARTGVDGFLLDGMDLLDHGPNDDPPCDADCFHGGLALVAALRKEFPDLIFLMQGGLSTKVREARVDVTAVLSVPMVSFIDGIVGEEVYTPSYSGEKESELLAWKAVGANASGASFTVATQDYVKTCGDSGWAELVYRASRSHGFSPAIGLSPVSRSPLCHFNLVP